MSKTCPKCGSNLPDGAKFCLNCGFEINSNINNTKSTSYQNPGANQNNSSFYKGGKIFLVLIILVVIVGGTIIFTSLGGGSTGPKVENVTLTITEVGGWGGSSSYSLYTEALFEHVPSNLEGYNIKTSYYDKNNNLIGSETESLKSAYYKTDYSIMIGYYTTYKKPNPDHVSVEIINDGNTINNYTYKFDQSQIEYLN